MWDQRLGFARPDKFSALAATELTLALRGGQKHGGDLLTRFVKPVEESLPQKYRTCLGKPAAIGGQLRACDSFLDLPHRRLRWRRIDGRRSATYQRMPADHFRRRAAEARRLAGDATTPAVEGALT